MRYIIKNCPPFILPLDDAIKSIEKDIKELARGLINGSIGGCEDDIGYMLQDILTKAEEE